LAGLSFAIGPVSGDDGEVGGGGLAVLAALTLVLDALVLDQTG
jgi:hypothetical protein